MFVCAHRGLKAGLRHPHPRVGCKAGGLGATMCLHGPEMSQMLSASPGHNPHTQKCLPGAWAPGSDAPLGLACLPLVAWVLPLFPQPCLRLALSPGNVPAGRFLLSHTNSPSVGLHHGQKPAPAPPWCPGFFCQVPKAQRMV